MLLPSQRITIGELLAQAREVLRVAAKAMGGGQLIFPLGALVGGTGGTVCTQPFLFETKGWPSRDTAVGSELRKTFRALDEP